ncbi:MAG: hypothetical protein M3347_15495, partial [Armatimonadota bacterium]|nr:hypothetical protein [Armatimonadota bacterium]
MNKSLVLLALSAAIASRHAAPAGSEPTVAYEQNARFLQIGGKSLFDLGAPWITTADWKPVRRFPILAAGKTEPIPGGRRTVRVDAGPHGQWTETLTEAADAVTIRYDFDFQPVPGAAHLQWFWRLEPAVFDPALVEATGARPVPLRPIAGTSVEELKQITFVLPEADLSVTCAAADGVWSFRDVRDQDWAKCYRLEYNRGFAEGDKRSGWFEVTLRGRPAPDMLIPLTEGAATFARSVRFNPGPIQGNAPDRKLKALLFWHTANGPAERGSTVGEIEVAYADGQKTAIPLRWESAVTSPKDDPRDLPEGALAPVPGGGPAWITAWRNPRPEAPIHTVTPRSLRAGWRLVALTGVAAEADDRRLTALLVSARSGALTEESVVSLDGTWRLQPAGGEERDVPVPSAWEQLPGLRQVHVATFRRTFDIPDALAGQRLLLHFDGVGDAAEVFVNGHPAGRHVGAILPFEADITELVAAPSQGNRLEVQVQDDTHFGAPSTATPRGFRHWMPRGMGANNRKGLLQSVSLRGRPPVYVADVRIQTSVRRREMTVVYEIFNSGRETLKTRLRGTVYAAGGSQAAVTLPDTPVELPGLVTTTVTTKAPFDSVTLWQPAHPALYTLRTLLETQGGQRLQRTETRFGFREVWFNGIHFYLNGIRCNLRGESPAYAEKWDLFATREAATEMIRRYQKVNFNTLRFHALPAPPHVLEICDELGMLVIDESAIYTSWKMLMPEHPQWMENCREHLTRWVRRDRNHPSVILWSAENEGLNVSGLTP